MKAFITVIGKDKIGIIHGVTTVLKAYQINILDITQTLLQEYFTMIMLVDLESMTIDFKELKTKLEESGQDLGMSIRIQHEDIFHSMHTI
ncbi:ACT domain-containing protein [Geosporobacter ferrireducens]|uniref:UPF0237 protein Gferi_15055 n=1 Tax=Geosporobacter ferrireducens TaxID=1424294 RepID=A0A1D8GIP3_9FIRM|nr:ACT domain-containing protein [Geosporobacter ferrireducens]AOT70777.1 hypothetical protein Gferi_15055 [Geosporobacter ferrireducens]MTI57267.1 ACT domain-containing protein [Geosporobacter ferrireducens]